MRIVALSLTKLALFIVGTGIVAAAAFKDAVVTVSHFDNAALALRFAPDDPVALVREAQVRLASGEGGYNGKEAMAAIRESLRGLALNGPALDLLGVIQGANGASQDSQRKTLLLSSRLSRQDLGTQLMLVEEAVARNDVATALDHYDVALRISESSYPILYPVLTKALDDPAIRRRFVPYLHAPPPWMESFLRFAVSTTENPASMVALAQQAGGFPRGPAYSSLDTELLTRLVSAGDYLLAVDYYRSLHGVSPGLLHTLALREDTTQRWLAPIAWQLFEIKGVDSLFLASERGGIAIDSRVSSFYSGPVAKKIVQLNPGKYIFSASQSGNKIDTSSSTTWRIECVGRSDRNAILNKTSTVADTSRVIAPFAIPADCPVQEVTLSAMIAPTISEAELVVEAPEAHRTR